MVASCSHKEWGEERADAIVMERIDAGPNMTTEFKEAWSEQVAAQKRLKAERRAPNPFSSSYNPPLAETIVNDYTPIETAEDGRYYDRWPGKMSQPRALPRGTTNLA